jgi:SAM-dependent methyltransferase
MMEGSMIGDVTAHGSDLPSRLEARRVRLRDPEAEAFREKCLARPHGVMTMMVRRTLARFISDYDANGILGTHDMHLLGAGAWRTMLERAGWVPPEGARLLDVGAGDGQVTAPLARLFAEVVTTEVSPPMVRRLRARGYRCHAVDLAHTNLPEEDPFHAVALLNVLDRTDRPLSLLARARNLVARDGCVLLAAPFPLSPHVHVGPRTVDPDEPLPHEKRSWEAAVAAFVRDAVEPAGLEVRALARVPYLCRGDHRHPVFELDDAVMVCVPEGG